MWFVLFTRLVDLVERSLHPKGTDSLPCIANLHFPTQGNRRENKYQVNKPDGREDCLGEPSAAYKRGKMW